ncbi:hypothetical protein [Paenibacillus sp. FSL R5-0473]|uniref:hypothetical protein n=1 Tax=Paenibacillus sp. FSL R5-0473 TaxID=2921642 RepID=UPI0030FCC329
MKEFATLQPYACPAQIIDLGSDSANLEKIMDARPDVIVTFNGSVDTIYYELMSRDKNIVSFRIRLNLEYALDDFMIRIFVPIR